MDVFATEPSTSTLIPFPSNNSLLLNDMLKQAFVVLGVGQKTGQLNSSWASSEFHPHGERPQFLFEDVWG